MELLCILYTDIMKINKIKTKPTKIFDLSSSLQGVGLRGDGVETYIHSLCYAANSGYT